MSKRPCGCPCCAPPLTREQLVVLLGPDYDLDPGEEEVTF